MRISDWSSDVCSSDLGLVAGALFVLPGVLAILGVCYVYGLLCEVPLVEGLFFGLKAAVLAVVLQAVVRVGSRALKNNVMRGFAALAFVAIFVLDVPFPLIVLAAALIGFFSGRAGYAAFKGGGGHGPAGAEVIHVRNRSEEQTSELQSLMPNSSAV